MKYLVYLLMTTTLFAKDNPTTAQVLNEPAIASSSNSKSVIMITAKERSGDFVQAFNLLRKEKPTLKISIRTANEVLNNITDLSVTQNGTLFLIKLSTPQGPKMVVLPLEDLEEISHSN